MNCDESFNDFQKTKNIAPRKINTRHKHVKKRKTCSSKLTSNTGGNLKEECSSTEHINNDSVVNDTIADDSEWECIICQQLVQWKNKDSHFADCIKIYRHGMDSTKDNEEEYIISPILCDICKTNITPLSVQERCEHVNKCLDSGTVDSQEDAASFTPKTVAITECPLCLKNCSTTEARLNHIKKCSKALGVDVPSVIVALQLQQKHTIERMHLGLPPVQTKPVVAKSSERLPKKIAREPKNENDANIQLAKALSLSVQEEEAAAREKECIELSDLSAFCFSNGPLELKPPKDDEKPMKKRKKINKPAPPLLLRTDEERQRLLEEKVSSIIALQYPAESCESTCTSSSEMCHLWNLCGVAEQKISYYVDDIAEFVIPSEVEAGSKLRSLSQVPGHHIYTQQPCDFTFGYSQATKLNDTQLPVSQVPLDVPSTQEMIDIIVNDGGDNYDCNEYIFPKDKAADQNQDLVNLAERSDGFFCEANEAKNACNPVIDSLKTLVGNAWMSDADIIVSGGNTIPVHMLLLKLRCPALRMELDSSPGERLNVLNWGDVSYTAAWHFIHYIYTGIKKWPSSLEMEIMHLAGQCEVKLSEIINCKNTADISTSVAKTSLSGKNLIDSQCDADLCDSSNSNDMLFEKTEYAVSENLNNCSSVKMYCAQKHTENISTAFKNGILENSCLLSQTSGVMENGSDIIHTPEQDIFVCNKTKSTVHESCVDISLNSGVTEASKCQNVAECSPDLFASETSCDNDCSLKSDDPSVIEVSLISNGEENSLCSSILKEQHKSISCDTTVELCPKSPRNVLEFEKVPLSPNTNMPKESIFQEHGTDRENKLENEFLSEGKYPKPKHIFHDFNPDSSGIIKSNYTGLITSSPIHKYSSSPTCTEQLCENICLASCSDTVAECKLKGFSLSRASSDVTNLGTPTTTKKKIRRNKSDSSVTYSTPFSKVDGQNSFSETRLTIRNVKKNIFGNYKQCNDSVELNDVHVVCSLKESEDLLNKEHCLSQVKEANQKDKFYIHSPIVLSSDEEVVESIDSKNTETSEVTESRNNSNKFCPPQCSQEQFSYMHKDISSDEELELVPLCMRIMKGGKEKNEDVQVIPCPEVDGTSSNELICYSQKCKTAGSKYYNKPSVGEISLTASSTPENKTAQFETLDKHSKNMLIGVAQMSDSPVTPLPDYKAMVTPDVKVALKRYGIRPLPKKRAIKLLTHIYEETHPWVELQENNSDSAEACSTISSASSCEEKAASKKRKKAEIEVCDHQKLYVKKSKLASRVPEGSSKKLSSHEHKENSLSNSQDSSGSQNSSGLEDMLEESYQESEDEVSTQKDASDSLKQLLYDTIRTNNDLYSKVLRYEPLDLTKFHQELKEKEIKISASRLMDFLDEECITFTLPRSEKFKKKQQARNQKFRKRMIMQLSQPNAHEN